jgi:hypothetical protein
VLGRRAGNRGLDDSIQNSKEQSAIPLPGKGFWVGAAVVFFLLALGPVLQVNGVEHAGVQPMPYTLIEKIPGLNISRSPDRFAMPLMLCLSVLAAGGVGRLAGRLGTRPWGSAALAAGLLVGQAVELWPVPFPQLPAPVPAFYGQLAADPDDYAILELPREDAYWHGAIRMYFQTAHHKRIFYGYISREYYHPFLDSTPGFMELQTPDGLGDVLAAGPDQWLSALADYDTRYVALYKKGWRPETPPDDQAAEYRAELARVIGAAAVAAPAHSDADLDLYRVPPPARRVPYLALGDGWGRREATPQEAHRWIRNDANLDLHNPTPAHLQLVFQANTLRDPRPLSVRREGGATASLNLDGALREYRVDLGPVPAGQTRLFLSSPGAVQSPRDLGMNDDPRPLGVFFTNVRVETVP